MQIEFRGKTLELNDPGPEIVTAFAKWMSRESQVMFLLTNRYMEFKNGTVQLPANAKLGAAFDSFLDEYEDRLGKYLSRIREFLGKAGMPENECNELLKMPDGLTGIMELVMESLKVISVPREVLKNS